MSERDHNLTQRVLLRAKKRIVPNWKSRLRDYSTIALGLTTALSTAVLAAWSVMPVEWKEALPKDAMLYLGGAYLVLGAWGAVGKFLTQPQRQERQE